MKHEVGTLIFFTCAHTNTTQYTH